jgi:hypothetical protein
MPVALTNLGLILNGPVQPMRFLVMDTTRDYAVIQATGATVMLLGISQQGTKIAPNLIEGLVGYIASSATIVNYAGIAGDSIEIFHAGDICRLVAGTGGWTPGALLTSDANGAGVVATTGNHVGALAMSACSVGEFGEVIVRPYKI